MNEVDRKIYILQLNMPSADWREKSWHRLMIQSTASSKSVIKNQIKTIFWHQIYVCSKDNTWPKLPHKKGIKVDYTIPKTAPWYILLNNRYDEPSRSANIFIY